MCMVLYNGIRIASFLNLHQWNSGKSQEDVTYYLAVTGVLHNRSDRETSP